MIAVKKKVDPGEYPSKLVSQSTILCSVRKNPFREGYLCARVSFSGFPCLYDGCTCNLTQPHIRPDGPNSFMMDDEDKEFRLGHGVNWNLVKRVKNEFHMEPVVNNYLWDAYPELRIFSLPFEDVADMDHMLVNRIQEVLFEDIVGGKLKECFKNDVPGYIEIIAKEKYSEEKKCILRGRSV